ncbi:MAG: hypothetical protein FJW26_13410 [Acidimicrobiia bacterium]|nr:hypothetical protein [Acidimicrobiia bacterium]
MTANAVSDNNSEIVVSGRDMFGAPFTEKARLLFLDKAEFSFSLFRPISEHQALQVSFEPERTNYCVEGLVTKVKIRLDGMQTVEMRVISGKR